MKPFETFIWNRIFIQLGGIIAIAAILGGFVLAYNATYNNVVNLDQLADHRWARLAHDMVERYGGIQGLADSIRPSLGPDGPVLDQVTRNLSRWGTALNGGSVGAINPATTNLEASLALLPGVIARYPEIAATPEVQHFLATLGDTEATIAADRSGYNEAILEYNQAIDSFPASLWASNWGFSRRDYFTARIGTSASPTAPAE